MVIRCLPATSFGAGGLREMRGVEIADPDIESLFAGVAQTGFRPARLVIAAVDPTLRVVCSARLCEGRPPQASYRPGVAFEVLFREGRLRRQVLDALDAVLAGETRTLEFEVDRGEGQARVRLHLFPRFQAPENRRGLFVIAHDVSDQQEARAHAEAMSDRFEAIFDHAADAMVIADEGGLIEAVNAAGERLFGWSREELKGEPLAVLMDGPYAATHQRQVERYIATGHSGILNVGPRPLPARHRNGEVLSIELAVGEARIAGARRFIGAARDISARLRQDEELRLANRSLEARLAELQQLGARLEEQRRRSDALADVAEKARVAAERAVAAKSKLLTTVSHEVRTPLNGVLAVADLLASSELPDSARRLVEIIRRSGRDLMGLVNEILDLSRLEAGALTIVAEPFSPAELIADLRDVWTIAAEAKGLRFSVEAQGLPSRLLGDADRIRQILANVISNAIKYTSQGAVRLMVEVAVSDGLAHLTFTVSDTGPGFDADLAERLFEPFARGAAEHSRRETGAGLGLAISRELVGLMGGDIRASNGAAGGAEIVVSLALPLGEPQADEPRIEAAPRMLDHPVRVLVAEDHEVNRAILGLLLDELGCAYELAVDGEAAVAAASAAGFDAILMDVRMPRMDGLEATRSIRGGGGPSADVPIIAITADALAADDTEIRDAGVTAVLTKPVTLLGLARTLEAALRTDDEPHHPVTGGMT